MGKLVPKDDLPNSLLVPEDDLPEQLRSKPEPQKIGGMWSLGEEDVGKRAPLEAIWKAPSDVTRAIGNAATRGAMRIPGLPAELLNLGSNVLEWGIDGKDWKDTTKIEDSPELWPGGPNLAAFGTGAIDKAFSANPDSIFGGGGLYDTKDPEDWRRYPAKAAEFAAGAGATGGAKTAAGLLSSIGAGLGNQLGQDIAPESPMAQIATTLMGLLAGGRLGNTKFTPPPQADAMPSLRRMDATVNKYIQNPATPGGTILNPKVADYANRLNKIDDLKDIQDIAQVDPAVARTALDKLMKTATDVEKAHMHGTTKPPLGSTLLHKAGKAGAHIAAHKLGTGWIGGAAAGKLWDKFVPKAKPADPFARLDKLREVIRTQKPFPVKPGPHKNLRGLLALLGEDED